MKRGLPTRLGKEPLIDVVCAAYFSSDVQADSLLPGLIVSQFANNGSFPQIESLGAAQLPQFVRDSDPALKNAPLMKIKIVDGYFVLIASRSIAVSCEMPYRGWSDYKEIIKKVFSVLCDANFVHQIERHSLKYVDFMKFDGVDGSMSAFNLNLQVAGRNIEKESTQLRIELVDGDFTHAVTVVSKANLNVPGVAPSEGALLDVDTHFLKAVSKLDFKNKLDSWLDNIHAANKSFFFDLLSDDGLARLEPIYV